MTIHPSSRIADDELREVMACAVALAGNPTRWGIEWLNLLKAIDRIEPTDELEERIADLELDLFGPDPEYRFVRAVGEAFDGDWVETTPVRSSYGMGGSAVGL